MTLQICPFKEPLCFGLFYYKFAIIAKIKEYELAKIDELKERIGIVSKKINETCKEIGKL